MFELCQKQLKHILFFQMKPFPISDSTHENRSSDEEEFWTLSGSKPFFSVILAKSHVHPYYWMRLPVKIQPLLPFDTIPVVLSCQGKEWNMFYNGRKKRFFQSWRGFVDENTLKIGDACVFELDEWKCKKLSFRVQILRGKIPPEVVPKIVGESEDFPIVIAE